MKSLLVRIGLTLGLVLVLALGALPALAAQTQGPGPVLDVANPSAGDMLPQGKYVISGVAFDPTATTGSGIDRVSVFLDSREMGGTHLGDAKLGLPNVAGTNFPQFATAGWTVTTNELQGLGEGHTLAVYARSSVTGLESAVTIPIVIGEKPSTTTPATIETIVTPPAVEPAPVVEPAPAF